MSVPGKLSPSDEPARLAMNSSTPPDHMPGLHSEVLCWSAVSAATNNQSSGCALSTHHLTLSSRYAWSRVSP